MGEGKEGRGWEEGNSSSPDPSPIITSSRDNTITLQTHSGEETFRQGGKGTRGLQAQQLWFILSVEL